MASSILHVRTLHLVRNRPVTQTYEAIANATGLSAHWIKTFARGVIPDPGVNKVEALYNHLAKQPLDLGDC